MHSYKTSVKFLYIEVNPYVVWSFGIVLLGNESVKYIISAPTLDLLFPFT